MANLDPAATTPNDATAAAQAAAARATQLAAEAARLAEQARDSTPHRPADDSEEIYYEGSPLMRGALGKGFLWVFGGVVLVVLAGFLLVRPDAPRFHVPWFVSLALAVIGAVLILVPVIRTKTVRYRITNYRVDYERGLFGKDIDTMELWHVEDLDFHQSFVDRLLGVGTITVLSHDDTTPKLVMHGIPEPRKLFEQLKQRIISVKRQRGVLKMDTGT